MSPERRFLGLEHQVALTLAEISTLAEAYPKVLESVGTALGWDFGAVWEESLDPTGFVRCAATWCADLPRLLEFARVSRETALPPGAGLPGRVWSSAAPAWIADVQSDPNFPRADAAVAAGLHAAFCFPIRTARGVVGAVEFMTHSLEGPDAGLIATTESLGSQIGQFAERGRAETAMREREARHGAILESALDCIITIDHKGRVLEFNSAAEQTFGYKADEIVSREMVEMIVPPGLRALHREGFARYLETSDPRILGQRLAITAMRADGTEFPVELTITRIPLPGPPAFTGFVRDITERKEAERELRASRVRLVGAQNEERRRLERNLHDGAQQRLVSHAPALQRARDVSGQDEQSIELLERAQEELQLALDELRELARGIHPAVLTERGLAPALEGVASRSTVPVELAALPDERLPEPIEAAVYYVVCEALVNVAKHANASAAHISVAQDDDQIVVEVSDDGEGGADAAHGSGLRGLADRVEALDGRLVLLSEASGTTLRAAIPLP